MLIGSSSFQYHFSVYEKLFERSDILSDVYMLSGGHSYKLWWTFSILLGIFSVFLSDIMSDVLGENVGHCVQNVRRLFIFTVTYRERGGRGPTSIVKSTAQTIQELLPLSNHCHLYWLGEMYNVNFSVNHYWVTSICTSPVHTR